MRERPLQQVRPVGFVAGCQLQSVSALLAAGSRCDEKDHAV